MAAKVGGIQNCCLSTMGECFLIQSSCLNFRSLKKNSIGCTQGPLCAHLIAILKAGRVQFAGHCLRAFTEVISSLLLWKPKRQVQRWRKLTFTDAVNRDTGVHYSDLGTAMRDCKFLTLQGGIRHLDRGRMIMMIVVMRE